MTQPSNLDIDDIERWWGESEPDVVRLCAEVRQLRHALAAVDAHCARLERNRGGHDADVAADIRALHPLLGAAVTPEAATGAAEECWRHDTDDALNCIHCGRKMDGEFIDGYRISTVPVAPAGLQRGQHG